MEKKLKEELGLMNKESKHKSPSFYDCIRAYFSGCVYTKDGHVPVSLLLLSKLLRVHL